ncbi:MAG: hypothetical protein KAT70_02530 [Thermoplasmata archaeon]|nr:hypothetical protein [Thermoplasmata archaeon]
MTILGIYLLFYAFVGLTIALALLGMGGYLITGGIIPEAVGYEQLLPIAGAALIVVGVIYLILAISRFGIAIGIFRMERVAWKGAFIIIGISILLDLIMGKGGSVFLGVIALLYLIVVRRHFRY